ncbi:MAG: glycosyltransferase [Proteobacteria bacterium]|nr:glycosyltransferase [Pseudomonadota bacterium]MBU1595412.1 glycosyltransferase [Pseudomonadota bacterium]
MRHRGIRRLIQALAPVLAVLARFRPAWALCRILQDVSPKTWLKHQGRIPEPEARPDGGLWRMAVVLDARSGGWDSVAETLRSLLQAHGAALSIHVLAADNAAEPASSGWRDVARLCRPRIWKPADFSQMLAEAAAAAELCLCVALNGRTGVRLHRFALPHLAAALGSSRDRLFAYCDEVLLRGRKVAVFCKPAWDRVLFETLNYIGPAILLRSHVLRAAALPLPQDCDLVEGMVRALMEAGQGSAAHLPLPLLQVDVPAGHAHPRPRSAPGPSARPQEAAQAVVSVIIPTRDHAGLLGTCLRTLRQTVANPSCLEIILVDNGSVCPAALALLDAEAGRGSRVLRDAGDFNFSRLINLGAGAATGSHLLLLNNDIAFGATGWLEEMLRYAVRRDTGCVGANLMYQNGLVQHAGIVLGMTSFLLGEHIAGHAHHGWPCPGPGYHNLLCSARSVPAVTGALLLVRRETFGLVRGFDPRLAVALNDVDFSLKVQQLGLSNVVVPVKGIVHLESASRDMDIAEEKLARLKAEAATAREKWGEALLDDVFYNPNLSLVMSYCLAKAPRQRRARARALGPPPDPPAGMPGNV